MRKLASVQKIKEINSIPDADKIEVCKILGWNVVTKKGEFKVGDYCVYFEIDSLIPRKPWNDFLANKDKPDAPLRLKTAKFRGQISQGLAIPVEVLGIKKIEEGTDLTDVLGVEKYEPPVPACLGGDVKCAFPSVVPKTGEIRIQAEPNILDEIQGIEMYWAIKADGTSGTYLNHNSEHHVCSRNWSLKETEGNTYWEMYHKYNLKDILDRNPNFAIQGEICGDGIQKNRLKLKGHHLLVFNVYDIEQGRVLGLNDMKDFCDKNQLTMVDVEKIAPFDVKTVDELIKIATQCKYKCGALGEGYVIRPVEPMYSKVLNGRMSFKIINPKYLVKHGE